MYEFLRMGGFPMWFVLAFGSLTLAAAISFARHPVERSVGLIRSLSVATVFIILSGVAGGLTMMSVRIPQTPEWANDPKLALIVMAGIGESLTLAIVGFAFLAVAWLVTALGVRRMGELV